MTNGSYSAGFIEQIIQKDLATGLVNKISTRFPPEPNGYLHLGHASSICLNFELAKKYNGSCYLRFDDTNPEKEEQKYIDAIQEDILWLGYQWDGEPRYASHYFEQFYQWAIYLIKQGKAYVDHQNSDVVAVQRGDFHTPGIESPYRNRSVEENLVEFEKMRQGVYEENSCSLRAKIDMQSANMTLRDPVMYRVRKKTHHQTGDKWCIYPSYDFAHGQEDAIEKITHSLCTLEFQDNRVLYEWFLNHLPIHHKPKQYEFARTRISYTVTSKRKLKLLVDQGIVCGWDDPRMPTLAGLRRRGCPASAIRNFCKMVGINRTEGLVDIAMLEFAIRDELNKTAPRAMAVMKPILITLINFEAVGGLSALQVPIHPDQPEQGKRSMSMSSQLYIDSSDFSEDSTLSRKKFKRLVLGDYVRLRYGYVIKAEQVIKNQDGSISEIKASIVEDTLGKNSQDPHIKPRGVIHWVNAQDAKKTVIRLYDRLFLEAQPDQKEPLTDYINSESLQTLIAYVEPYAVQAKPETVFQFEREGYFVADRYDHTLNTPTFNLTIALKDHLKTQ